MALVLTCNECGDPIDETGPYFSATVIEMNAPLPEGEPPMTPATIRLDWHVDHLPGQLEPGSREPPPREPR